MRLPGLVRKKLAFDPFLRFAPSGHFYSPLPDPREVRRRRALIFDVSRTSIPGLDLHTPEQLRLLEQLAPFMPEQPWRDEPAGQLRYHFRNSYFGYGDALMLYGLLRHLKPQRIIEVGSGFSSALMLDTADRWLPTLECTFIEPYPQQRLDKLMREGDRQRHHVRIESVQDVPLEMFQVLRANDILFIDSSHVVKVGSDVVYLLTEVLPSISAGVWVHVHDIFWPFEYPERWVSEGRAWNEAYMLKAFLQCNDSFAIRLFMSYLVTHHHDAVSCTAPLALQNPGGGLWVQKLR